MHSIRFRWILANRDLLVKLCDTKKSTDEVSRLLSAFSNVDREKKQLEAKVVELQVAAARSAAQDHHTGEK